LSETIGVIGVGRMGSGLLARLDRAGGWNVLACDARPERRGVVQEHGATWVGDAGELAARADVLITLLPGSPELAQAMEAPISALRQGSTWIDMTSAAPDVGLALMGRARERGAGCLDAPVGGGPQPLGEGRAQLFVGGDSGTLRARRDLLGTLGRIEHVGELGAGYTAKLIVNLLWFSQAVSTAEALLLARRRGLDLARLQPVLARSAAAGRFIENDLPRVLEGDYLRDFGLDRCCEELEALVELADEAEVPFELSRRVSDAYARALARYGAVDGELLAVMLLEERAGVRLRGGESE
jgi:3-hydroxyisobutyrate dehydrogenase-like beta-hydroxyacid dehydrogenase